MSVVVPFKPVADYVHVGGMVALYFEVISIQYVPDKGVHVIFLLCGDGSTAQVVSQHRPEWKAGQTLTLALKEKAND